MARFLKHPTEIDEIEKIAFAGAVGNSEKEIYSKVSKIVEQIKNNGDSSLIEFTEKFDGWEVGDPENLKVSEEEIEQAYNSCGQDVLDALELAALRIQGYHEGQITQIEDITMEDDNGVEVGWKWTSIEKVGIYVPGGTAAYPSSVLMNAIPARVGGVEDIVMVTPASKGEMNPLVLASAKIAGITEIYKIGGAQAIAALAFGTETVPNVYKIVGPGNAYVAEAKRQLFGLVGIDTIAGPSEILVISDKNSSSEWIAAGLLSQAEHDKNARSILVTDDEDFAKEVEEQVEQQLGSLERKDIAAKSWNDNGLVIVTENIDQALEVANMIAPEHLELCVDNAEELVDEIDNAGAIFVGRFTPEAIGDYTAGPSHVLPTSGAARFSSGLSVYDFLKRSSVISCSENGFRELADATTLLALKEGLDAHAKSVIVRKSKA